MSDQSVYFNTGLDTDERAASTAIQPIVAGERVQAAVVDRPLEILRARTETLREQTEEQKFLQDSDMRWIITGGDPVGVASGNDMPRVTWNKTTSKFTIIGGDNDVVPCMILQPIQGPNTDKKGTHTYAFTGALSGNVIASTTYFAYEGGARHQVVWAHAAAAGLGVNKCSVVFTGTPVHTMTITVATEGTTQLIDLSAQLTAVGMPLNGFSVSFTGDMAALLDFTQIPPGDVTVTLTGTYDRELHYITKAQIDQFFITEGETIMSGDTLGIYYPFMVDPNNPTTRGGRRQATPTSAPGGGGANTAVTAAQLFLASAEPEKIAQSIPICKRIGDDLIFIDGTVVRGDELTTPVGTVYFGSNGYLTHTFNSTTAGSSGSTQIGVAAHTHHGSHASDDVIDLTADTLQVNLEAIQLLLNNKASLDANEPVDGQWLFNNTSFVVEPTTTTPFLMWRSGTVFTHRPSDGQVGWQTISKYVILNSTEYAYVTIQGGYLVYSSGYKIHTPATGTGNLVVTIESAGSTTGHASDNNIRGNYRRYNAAANTLYDLYPANWLTEYTSGFVSYESMYTLWGTIINFATGILNIIAPIVTQAPNTEVNTVGSKVLTHTSPTLISLSGGLGAHNHAYFNRVLEGFMITPAPLVLVDTLKWSSGCFPADTIGISPGRAIVAGNIVTIPEARVLTGVVNNHLLPYTTMATNATYCKWFGVWLRSDGVIRIGPLPFMDTLHAVLPAASSYIPGNTMYMLPVDDGSGHSYVDPGYDRHDYTLINIVWSYDGNTASNIRFAGMTHAGGNLWVYHQARKGAYVGPDPWTTYIDHVFLSQEIVLTSLNMLSISADTSNSRALPGVPTVLSLTAVINVQVNASFLGSGSQCAFDLFAGDNSSYLNDHYSTTYTAPPFEVNVDSPAIFTGHDRAYTFSAHTSYASSVYGKYISSANTSGESSYHSDTIIYPYLRPSDFDTSTGVYNVSNETVGVVDCGSMTDLTTGDTVQYKLRTIGFMWDRCSPSGIGF